MGSHFEGSPVMFVNDTQQLREIFNEEKCRKLEFVYDGLKLLLGDGLVTSYGNRWKQERRLLTPIFHFKSLQRMPEIMNHRIIEFCENMKASNGEPVLASAIFGNLTLRIVIDCVFGGDEYLNTNDMVHLYEKAGQSLDMFFFTEILFGKVLNYIIPFPWNMQFRKYARIIRSRIQEAIDKKRKQLQSTSTTDKSDLMNALLAVRDEQGNPIPDKLIQDESFTFLFAGHDTTSSTLSWAFSFLVHEPEIVEKIREEADSILSENEYPSFENIKDFHYAHNVIKETLRMRPPVPLLDRRVAQPIEIDNKVVPVGTCIYPVIIAAHYDNRYWKEPFKFRPERWDPNNKDTEPDRDAYSFLPFSASTRNCIGQKFSLMESVLILVIILRQFNVVSSMTPDEVIWQFQGTMKPTNFKCSFVPIKK